MKNPGSVFADFVRSIVAAIFMIIGFFPIIFVFILAGVVVFFLYCLVMFLV